MLSVVATPFVLEIRLAIENFQHKRLMMTSSTRPFVLEILNCQSSSANPPPQEYSSSTASPQLVEPQSFLLLMLVESQFLLLLQFVEPPSFLLLQFVFVDPPLSTQLLPLFRNPYSSSNLPSSPPPGRRTHSPPQVPSAACCLTAPAALNRHLPSSSSNDQNLQPWVTWQRLRQPSIDPSTDAVWPRKSAG